MRKKFQPMLASQADTASLRYPLLLSPKYDGIRAVVLGGRLLSRRLKPIPNGYIQSMFRNAPISKLEGLDGELIVGSPTSPSCYHVTESAVMSKDGEPDFAFYVFDLIAEPVYLTRFGNIAFGKEYFPSWLKLVRQKYVSNVKEYEAYREHQLKLGYEGIMIRDPEGPYKYGRSTVKEGWLLKDKPFEDSEGEITDFEEQQHNGNTAERDERGYTKRSSAKVGKSGKRTLGVLILNDPKWPSLVRVGTGFDDATRKSIWNNQSKWRGRLVKYRYQATGIKDAPRGAVFVGFRDAIDM